MRNAVVNYVDGIWHIGLMENHVVKYKRAANSYHEIGSIISNWILNGEI